MTRGALIVIALWFPALTQVVQAETYTLEAKDQIGDRAEITETRESNIRLTWKSSGNAGNRSLSGGLKQHYVEEVRQAKPLITHRDYTHSAKTKVGKSSDDELTSLHGRAILVQGFTMKPLQKFKISPRDQQRLRFDRLAKALLPPSKVVSPRDSWSISNQALASAIFERSGSTRCEAKVTLRSVKKKKGAQIATLKVRLKLHQARIEETPAITMLLKGELKWDIEEGKLAEAHLTGTLAYTFKNTNVGKESTTEGKGPFRWSYQAEFLPRRAPATKAARVAGAHPPPGTQRLVCDLNEAHTVPLTQYTRCLMCGAKFGKGFKCTKNDCPWPFQFCPRDGAPFGARAK